MVRTAILITALIVLTACGGGKEEAPDLLNIRQGSGDGPDEFAILPTKPLVLPSDMTALPTPTPGGSNRTDPQPEIEVARALGGNAGVLDGGLTDRALFTHVSRFGVQENIRATLAALDLEFRRANDGKFLERLFNVNVYFSSYSAMELDQYAELERLRRAGIRTSAVPPDPTLER
ncbi:MAG: DUF3035 domain-containing protein [Boseongicola sp.]|nr:MAG: DUF3035 domain-containing protein [Boseongicola sp.]